MKSLTTKILAGVLCVLLFAVVGSQLYYRINDKHKTEEAVLCEINDNLSFKGVIVRDEKVIKNDTEGVLDYRYTDGSKISVGSTIANVYKSQDDIAAQNQIEKLKNSISMLERAQNPGTINYVQPDTLKTKIDNEYNDMLTNSLKKDYDSLSKTKNDLSVVLNIYNIITGSVKNYSDQIKSMKSEVSKLNKSTKPIKQIKSSNTGYFVSYADGYESKLKTNNINKLTEKDITDIINSKPQYQDNVVGKMFSNYSCKIVGIINNDKRISEGSSLNLMLSSSKSKYNVTVDSIKPAKDNNKSIVVFSCDRLDESLVDSRVQSAKIVFDEYEGLKIPRKAIRFKNKDKGVYVLLGNDITFKKIDVIYENEDDDFVISKNTSNEEYVLLYDQILMEVISESDVSDKK